MGWTSTNVQVKYKNGKEYIDRKEECDKLFNQPMVTMESNDIIGKYEVLKSSMRGTVYYAAVKKTKFATETESEQSSIFAAICLTSVEKDSHYNFSYKDMDETCNPFYYDCPVGILKLLSPTDNEYALEWRKKCEKRAEDRLNPYTLSRLPVGSIVKFKAPFDMTRFKKGEDITVQKMHIGKSNRWMNGSYYYPSHIIGDEYEVMRRGNLNSISVMEN